MQYALIPVSKGGEQAHRLIDAGEISVMEHFKGAVEDLPNPPESGQFYVCYGSYMPQPGITAEKALEDLMTASDHYLGYINREHCHSIAFHGVEAYASRSQGRSVRIPFSAVIQADPVVIERMGAKAGGAVTAFLRFKHEMDPVANILNRPGIIALKGVERRTSTEAVTLENWKTFADSERAKRTCHNIF
jgi:hypothetical protein